ncbi:hypothetical protein LOK49_LG11G01620 [Camellia lanceoleosa]|uniref:Uncharacterized protein n=1 Tax=Camellia lanceoleosa TaxID=1840588 RepID=A0ACC0G3C2_9ERIC|nr:hypothetical protein LOK49_LG11G01620 [Camellia lanceoleosa]
MNEQSARVEKGDATPFVGAHGVREVFETQAMKVEMHNDHVVVSNDNSGGVNPTRSSFKDMHNGERNEGDVNLMPFNLRGMNVVGVQKHDAVLSSLGQQNKVALGAYDRKDGRVILMVTVKVEIVGDNREEVGLALDEKYKAEETNTPPVQIVSMRKRDRNGMLKGLQ